MREPAVGDRGISASEQGGLLRLMTCGIPLNICSATRAGSPVTRTKCCLTSLRSAPPSGRPCMTTR